MRDLDDADRDKDALHWAGDPDQDQDAWDMAFDAMYETGWALDEQDEDRKSSEAYRRWQREQSRDPDREIRRLR